MLLLFVRDGFKGQATYKESTGSSTHVSPGGSKPLINQPFPPEKKNQLWALSSPIIFLSPIPSKRKTLHLHKPAQEHNPSEPAAVFPQFPLWPPLPWSFLCLLGPDAGEPQSLSGGSDFRSAERGDWKLESTRCEGGLGESLCCVLLVPHHPQT